MTAHPSFLRLDKLALGLEDKECSAHLASCDQCRAHQGRLEQPVAVPRSVRELAAKQRPLWPRLVFLAGAVAAVALVVGPRGTREMVTSKGNPSVAVYVKRGERVSLWDGQQPLRAGDSVQLKVQPAGFSLVTVGSVEGSDVREIYRAKAAGDSAVLLGQAFTLDGAAADEQLLIVFSRDPVDLRAAREKLPRDGRLWTTLLNLTDSRTDR
jgi:hypothetical protein